MPASFVRTLICSLVVVLLGSATIPVEAAEPKDPFVVHIEVYQEKTGRRVAYSHQVSLEVVRRIPPWKLIDRKPLPLKREEALGIAAGEYRRRMGQDARFHPEDTALIRVMDLWEQIPEACKYYYYFQFNPKGPPGQTDMGEVVVLMDGTVAERVPNIEHTKFINGVK